MALDPQDLEGRIESTVHFDEYKPKMGKDDAVIVATFKVFGKQPAQDLENFIEMGYDWVIDAETSAGEISEGRYIVFIEAERRSSYPQKFMSMINDLNNLTDVEDWMMVYFDKPDSKKNPVQPLNTEALEASIPLSPKKYRDTKTAAIAIESILNTARVPRTKGDINEFRAFTRRSRD
jgi:nitrate reductase NapAB chaperone NapD